MKRNKVDRQMTMALDGGGDTREAYSRIRNFLAGRLVGATRDSALVDEVLKCIFCRALSLRDESPVPDDPLELAKFYRSQFGRLKTLLPSVFEQSAEILLDPTSLRFVDQQLKGIDFLDPQTDAVGDAYEAFIGSAERGAEGQFFTPQRAVQLLVEMADPKPGERVIDPACGAGGFLSYTARRLMRNGASAEQLCRDLVGVDKDSYLAKLAKAHVGLVTLGDAHIWCADSLAWVGSDGSDMPMECELGAFDVVLANPPFGAKIVAASAEVQSRFELGFSWKMDRDGRWKKTTQLQRRVSPQILFVERLLSLVRPGGRVGVVLPESLLSGKSYRHVVQYMRDKASLRAVVGMPEDLFKTSGKGGTHTKVCLLLLEKRDDARGGKDPAVFFAEAEWCGNDSRGRQIDRDDLPEIGKRFRASASGQLREFSRLGYEMKSNQITENILAPRYYDPEVLAALERLSESHELISVKELLERGTIELSTGHEVGKLSYGGGTVPFVRTSDISNWEVKRDPKHCVSDEVYESLAKKQDVQAGDILMVRDGTYLIGTCAFVTEYDTRIVYQSHMYKIRVKDRKALSPYLLLAVLSSAPVQRQVEAKRFTQDIIDSLGDRISELVLPIPRDAKIRKQIETTVEKSIRERVISRELARKACVDVVRSDWHKVATQS